MPKNGVKAREFGKKQSPFTGLESKVMPKCTSRTEGGEKIDRKFFYLHSVRFKT